MNIYIFKVKKNYDYSYLIQFVPRFKQKYIKDFKNKKDINSHVMSYILLLYAFNQSHINSENVKFYINEYGKPYINKKDTFFNISQTDNYIAVAINNEETGIDINEIEKYSKSFVNFAFNLDEQKEINRSKNKNLAFTKVWTKKEAYLKYLGTGLKDNLKNIAIDKSHLFLKTNKNYVLACFSTFKNVKMLNVNHEKIIAWSQKYFFAK